MELGVLLSKGGKKNLKSTSKTKREMLEMSVVNSTYKFSLHKPVCNKLSHMADSSFPADGHLGILKDQMTKF